VALDQPRNPRFRADIEEIGEELEDEGIAIGDVGHENDRFEDVEGLEEMDIVRFVGRVRGGEVS